MGRSKKNKNRHQQQQQQQQQQNQEGGGDAAKNNSNDIDIDNNNNNNDNNKKRKAVGQSPNSNSNNNSKRQGRGGGKGKGKGRQQQHKHNKQRQKKQQRFWIEDCKDTKIKDSTDTTFQVEVLITRSEVTDDYRQVSKSEINSSINDTAATAAATETSVDNDDDGDSMMKNSSTNEKEGNETSKCHIEEDLKDGNHPSPLQQPDVEEAEEGDSNKTEDGNDKSKNKDASDPNVDIDVDNDDEKHVQQVSADEERKRQSIDDEKEDSNSIQQQKTPPTLTASLSDTKTTTNHPADGDEEATAFASPISEQQGKKKSPGGDQFKVSVKRSKNAKRPIKSIFHSVENFVPLPNGDCGDGIVNPYPKDVVADKFWSQRRRLFTRYDEGIQLDSESWYSVTPEAIANHIANRIAATSATTTTYDDDTSNHHVQDEEKETTTTTTTTTNEKQLIVVDLFCGCGGNTIAFALKKEIQLVVCVDSDESKLMKAANNAKIYGIPPEKMVFVHGDALNLLKKYKDGKLIVDKKKETAGATTTEAAENASSLVSGYQLTKDFDSLPNKIDILFLSPPWGGMDYSKVGKRNYTLDCIKIKNSMTSSNNNDNDIDKDKVVDECDGDTLLERCYQSIGSNAPVILFLPKNINGYKLGVSACRVGYTGPIILEQNVLNGKLKTVTAYLGL